MRGPAHARGRTEGGTPIRSAAPDRPPTREDLHRALSLARRYDRPGPRYTSYPPAPHFTGEVAADMAREAYAARGPDAPLLSLHVHLPFCDSTCHSCGRDTVAARDRSVVDRYLDGLAREAALASRALFGGPRTVAQLHLGGGTPTYFPPEALEWLHGMLRRWFSIAEDAELRVEMAPGVTTRRHVTTLARLGWRQMSVDVQDFDPVVRAAVGRPEGAEETEALVRLARAAGFSTVNVDLEYGLPHQTPSEFRRTLDAVLDRLDPDRVRLLGSAHVSGAEAHQRGIDEDAFPGPASRLALFHAGVETFVGAGYEFIGLDHFAKPGDALSVARRSGALRRNVLGFHARAATDVVGLGITAIGDVGGVELQNRHRITGWELDLADGRLPVERGLPRTKDDRVRGAVIEALLCNGHAPAALLADGTRPWTHAWAPEVDRLHPMEDDGLVVLDEEDGMRLTPLGRLFARNVCMVFDDYLGRPAPSGSEAPRYSRTV